MRRVASLFAVTQRRFHKKISPRFASQRLASQRFAAQRTVLHLNAFQLRVTEMGKSMREIHELTGLMVGF